MYSVMWVTLILREHFFLLQKPKGLIIISLKYTSPNKHFLIVFCRLRVYMQTSTRSEVGLGLVWSSGVVSTGLSRESQPVSCFVHIRRGILHSSTQGELLHIFEYLSHQLNLYWLCPLPSLTCFVHQERHPPPPKVMPWVLANILNDPSHDSLHLDISFGELGLTLFVGFSQAHQAALSNSEMVFLYL